MDSGDSDNKIILIKQEVESNEINETVDVANIKSEQEDATYGIQCDGVKVETLKLKYQDESESGMFNPEYVWVDSKQEEVWKAESEKIDAIASDSSQPTEESGNIESNTNAETTYDPEQHRMKVELTDENWCSTAIDGDVQVKTEVKSEKLEDEAYMVPKFEQMDTLDLNEEVDIKPDGDPITTSDSDCATQEKQWGEELQVDHAEAEKGLFLCYNCNYIASSKIYLIKHIKLRKCKSKSNSSKSRPSYAYFCPQCNKVFKEKTILDDHVIKKHVNLLAPVSSKMHKSPQSNYKSTNENNITRRLSTHPGVVSKLSMCKPCNATFKNNESLDDHILKKHPEFKLSIRSDLHECPYRPYCKYKTTIKTYLKSHMLSHSKEREITCKHCNMSFKRKYTLDNHIIKKHPDFIASVKRKIHECSCCAFKTIHKSALDVHMLIHSADKVTHKSKHECSSCSFKAIHKSTIDRHMKTHSSDKFKGIHREIHQCSYCEFKAIHKSTLDRHMLTHSKDKVVTCKHCNIEFKNKEAVNEHIVRAHSSFLASLSCKIYSCTHCYYKTTIQHLFDKHLLKHHEVATDRGKC